MKAEVDIRVTSKGGEPGPLFGRADMLRIGRAVAAAIVDRTDGGLSADGDAPFVGYSRTPLWMSDDEFPKPRGGVPTGGGVWYEGGYRQYKRDTLGSARPNLTKTGEMLQSVGVQDATAGAVRVGPSRPMLSRALGNQQRRPWLGHSPASMEVLDAELQDILDEKDLFAGSVATRSTTKVVK